MKHYVRESKESASGVAIAACAACGRDVWRHVQTIANNAGRLYGYYDYERRKATSARCSQSRGPLDNTHGSDCRNDVSFSGAVGRRERSAGSQPGLYSQANCDSLACGEPGELDFWHGCASKVQRGPVDHSDQATADLPLSPEQTVGISLMEASDLAPPDKCWPRG